MFDVPVILPKMPKDAGTTPTAYCRGCDYDLRGLPDKHRCPECGREFDRNDPRSVRNKPRTGVWRKARWVVYPILVIVLAAGAGVAWTYWEWKREQPVIAWANAHRGPFTGGAGTKPIAPAWLQRRAGRWAYLLERVDSLLAVSDEPVKPGDVPLSRLRHLTWLHLEGGGMGDDLVGEVGQLLDLKDLTLRHTTVTDEGLARLSACRQLERLYMRGSRVGDKGLAPLADQPTLTVLEVGDTPVDGSALPVLKGLTTLKFLDLGGTRITPAGVAELRKALPNCKIDDP